MLMLLRRRSGDENPQSFTVQLGPFLVGMGEDNEPRLVRQLLNTITHPELHRLMSGGIGRLRIGMNTMHAPDTDDYDQRFTVHSAKVKLTFEEEEELATEPEELASHASTGTTVSDNEADALYVERSNRRYQVTLSVLRSLPVSLPDEILVDILRLAGVHKILRVSSTEVIHGMQNANREYVRLNFPTTLTREDITYIEELEIMCRSKDQGWATGVGSWTWGEAAVVEQASEAQVMDRFEIFRNERGGRQFQNHVFTANHTHPLCTEFQPGRSIVVWIRSCFPGWTVKMESGAIILKYH
jgi:hypothetical protein